MTLFTVGPVEMYPETLAIMGTQEPYFRTAEFSEVMLRIERNMMQAVNAPEGSRYVLLTSSGTGGMAAAVENLLVPGVDRALVVNGGSFGARFASICQRAGIAYDQIALPLLEGDLTSEMLEAHAQGGHKALLIQGCETSSGRLYDLKMVGEFCKRHNILLVVDAVSAFLADEVDMTAQHIDVFFTASQKALALAPDLAPMICSPHAVEAIERGSAKASYYFDLPSYFKNQERGQTPFTCAVSSVLALDERMHSIMAEGVAAETVRHAERARYFRSGLADVGFALPSIPLSNCCTPLVFPEGGAERAYNELTKNYGLVLCPSGGAQKDMLLRVGHMGNLGQSDYDELLRALKEVC